MSDSKFRFVSPGIQLREIDKSQIPNEPDAVGPIIIGRAERGPALRPVKVQNFTEFVEIFGEPLPGGKTGDIWRDGSAGMEPNYGAYAAQAYLANGTPLTYVRLLGQNNSQGPTTGDLQAGWQVGGTPNGTYGRGGAVGLWVFDNTDDTGARASATITVTTTSSADSWEAKTVLLTNTSGTLTTLTTDITVAGAASTSTIIGVKELYEGAGSPTILATALTRSIDAGTSTHGMQASRIAGVISVTASALGSRGNRLIGGTLLNTTYDVTGSGFSGGGPTPAVTGTLAAVFYCTGSSIELSGGSMPDVSSISANLTGSGIPLKSIAAGPTFTFLVKDENGNITDTINANVKTPTEGNFIRKVFNTDPTKLSSRLYGTANTSSYFLGESFERAVSDTLASGTSGGDCYGFISALDTRATSNRIIYGKNYASMTPARTNWIIAQSIHASASSTPEADTTLFQVVALDSGEWTQENVKISISDVRYSNEPSYPWGSFGLLVRRASDSDEAPQVLESFSNLELNPASPNYIARRIGNQYAEWDDTDRRYRYHEQYANNSKYIRIVMSDSPITPTMVPFGYRGPPKFGSFTLLSGSTTANQVTADLASPSAFAMAVCNTSGSVPGFNDEGMAQGPSQPFLNVGPGTFTASFNWPTTWVRNNTTQGNLNDPSDAFFGLSTNQTAGSTRFSDAYQDVVRGLPDIFRTSGAPTTQVSYSALGNTTEYSYVFSLDNVSNYTASLQSLGEAARAETKTQSRDAYYFSGSYKLGYSISTSGSNSYKDTLDADFNKFTVPMFGGFNGTDIRETNPFNNYYAATPSLTTNAKFNSIRQAIDSCGDPDIVEGNVMCAPGIGTTAKSIALTNHMLDVCRRRGDMLAVIDIEGGYQPAPDRTSWVANGDTTTANRGKASTAASSLKTRQINNSYGACYYPWIQVRDSDSGVSFFAPPSIAAIGTYAYSEAQSEVWFAPAGFTRGGLSEGAGGIPIIGVTERLSSKDRDTLYENNINPIASFPAEGLVVFGQKTLQATRSALDRVNVRRLMIHVKKEISRISAGVLFDPNTQVTWDRFTGQAGPFLESVKARLGLEDYKIILDSTTTTPDMIDRNIMYAKIFLKPTRAIEFIAVDFIITNTGASFQD